MTPDRCVNVRVTDPRYAEFGDGQSVNICGAIATANAKLAMRIKHVAKVPNPAYDKTEETFVE